TFDRASLAFVPLTSLYPYPFFFCLVKRLQPTSTLFPYTTLFRSGFRNRRPHRAAIVAVIGVRQMSWVSWVCAWPHLEPGPKLGLEALLPFSFPAPFFSGFTRATIVPGEMPSRIARPSLSARTFPSCLSKPRWRLS